MKGWEIREGKGHMKGVFWQDIPLELCLDCVSLLVAGEESSDLREDYPLKKTLEEWAGWFLNFEVEVMRDNGGTAHHREKTESFFSSRRCDCGGLAGDRWECIATRKLTASEALVLQMPHRRVKDGM